MRDVSSPINKPRPAGSPALVKVRHAPVYGPPATGSRNAGPSSPAISAAISVTRAGGRDLSNPDPFPGRGRMTSLLRPRGARAMIAANRVPRPVFSSARGRGARHSLEGA